MVWRLLPGGVAQGRRRRREVPFARPASPRPSARRSSARSCRRRPSPCAACRRCRVGRRPVCTARESAAPSPPHLSQTLWSPGRFVTTATNVEGQHDEPDRADRGNARTHERPRHRRAGPCARLGGGSGPCRPEAAAGRARRGAGARAAARRDPERAAGARPADGCAAAAAGAFAVLEEPVQELPAQEAPPQPPPAHVFRRGDWREAAANIHDELAIALGPRAATG